MEPCHNCLTNNVDLLDENSYFSKSCQGLTSINGIDPCDNVRQKNCYCRCLNSSSIISPATPAMLSQKSNDSGSLSTPSCESSNHFSSHRKTQSSYESVSSDACQEPDSKNNSNDIQDSIEIPNAELSYSPGNCPANIDINTVNALALKLDKSDLIDTKYPNIINLNCENGNFSYFKIDSVTSLPISENVSCLCKYATLFGEKILKDAILQSVSMGWSIHCSGQCRELSCQEDFKRKDFSTMNRHCKTIPNCSRISCSSNLCWTPELPFSPNHSRTSQMSSISCSHDSLVVSHHRDDSRFIKEAVSHELLYSSNRKNQSKLIDPEIYSCPVDTLKPYQRRIFHPKAIIQQPRSGYPFRQGPSTLQTGFSCIAPKEIRRNEKDDARGVSTMFIGDESNVTRHKKVNKKNSKNDSGEHKQSKINTFHNVKWSKKLDKEQCHRKSLTSNIRNAIISLFNFRKVPKELGRCINAENDFIDASKIKNSPGGIKWGKICPLPSAPPLRHSTKFSAFSNPTRCHNEVSSKLSKSVPSDCRSRQSSLLFCLGHPQTSSYADEQFGHSYGRKSNRLLGKQNASQRALPPLPKEVLISPDKKAKKDEEGCDFASIIDKVKDYGWYWGPISGEAAEKVLSNEPDGSFIVRDSSDYHYIFSLTFRLNGVTRHVRIEHDQGNFSFGGFTRFKSQTIVDFIEKAVEHSRSGRYLFFLHRRPVLGPMRVQLLHPISRFKHVQSLQHLCRFAIVNHVRRDLIDSLPLPHRLKEYLSSPHYYSELVERCMADEAEETTCQSPLSSKLQTPSSEMENTQNELIGATALSPSVHLPSQFNYQFTHEQILSDDLNDVTIDHNSNSHVTVELQLVPEDSSSNLMNVSSLNKDPPRISKSQSVSFSSYCPFFVPPVSPYSVMSTELSRNMLLKSMSFGDMRESSRKSAYIHNNLLSALALETKSSALNM